MKKGILLILLTTLLFVPSVLFAKEATLNFQEALEEERIEETFESYKENDKQAIIYLFRGRGCSVCRSFLTFLNSITDEYGKKFKVVSYEVWYNTSNNKLLDKVADFTGVEAGGVPYIVIGDQVFGGYTSSYDDTIKKAIDDLYDTPVKERYDVLKELEKAEKEATKSTSSNTMVIVLCNLLFFALFSAVVIIVMNKKFKKIEALIKNKK